MKRALFVAAGGFVLLAACQVPVHHLTSAGAMLALPIMAAGHLLDNERAKRSGGDAFVALAAATILGAMLVGLSRSFGPVVPALVSMAVLIAILVAALVFVSRVQAVRTSATTSARATPAKRAVLAPPAVRPRRADEHEYTPHRFDGERDDLGLL